MENNQQINISVIDPISPAFERTKFILFNPFDMGKWFIIGFCAFLAYLNQGCGPNFTSFSNFGNNGNGNSTHNIQNLIPNNLPLIIIIIAVAVVFSIALGILLAWLSSRGRFMFLHCIAKNVAQIKAPWSAYRSQGNSLFLFSLSVGFIMLFIVAIFVGSVFLSAMLIHGGQTPLGIIVIVFLSLGFICLLISTSLTIMFTNDFVVPIMYIQRCRCIEAWSQFWPVLMSNKGKFTLYILFQIVINITISMVVLCVVLITCCLAGCLMIIPYIGSVATLPITVFKRSYSLYYLRQFSPHFNVFEEIQQVLHNEETPPPYVE